MSIVTDPRPFYAENFTAPTDAVPLTPATFISVPSNTDSIIIYNREAVGGRVLQFAIFDTFAGTRQFGTGQYTSIPSETLPNIALAPLVYLQQIGLSFVIAGASLELFLGPEGNRTSLTYVTTAASGFIDVNEPVTIAAGNTFTSDTFPSTGPFVLTAAVPVDATGTITVNTPIVGDTVTVGGIVFTAVASTATPTSIQFQLGATNTLTAVNLATAIGAHTTLASASPWLRATSALNVVTLAAPGVLGNAVALATSTVPRLPISGAFLAGGAGPAVNTFDIGVATATTTAAGVTASNISVALNAVANAFDTFLITTATTSTPSGASTTVGGRVNISATGVYTPGVVGDNIPMAVTGTGMVVSAARLLGGAPDRYVLLFQGVTGTVSTSVILTQGRGYTGPP